MSGILPMVLENGDVDRVNVMGPLDQRIHILKDGVNTISPPRLMKSHYPYAIFQRWIEEENLKVIVVLRNPKDVLVSFFHMYCANEILGNFQGDFHDFFELFKAKRLVFGDLFDWCKVWWQKKHLANILIVRYEDMVQDCPAVVKQVAEFCKKDLDPQIIQKIVDHCSIDNMRKDPMSQPQTKGVANARYRKGKIGDWKNYFSEQESNLVDQLCKEHFDPIGLSFQYE